MRQGWPISKSTQLFKHTSTGCKVIANTCDSTAVPCFDVHMRVQMHTVDNHKMCVVAHSPPSPSPAVHPDAAMRARLSAARYGPKVAMKKTRLQKPDLQHQCRHRPLLLCVSVWLTIRSDVDLLFLQIERARSCESASLSASSTQWKTECSCWMRMRPTRCTHASHVTRQMGMFKCISQAH